MKQITDQTPNWSELRTVAPSAVRAIRPMRVATGRAVASPSPMRQCNGALRLLLRKPGQPPGAAKTARASETTQPAGQAKPAVAHSTALPQQLNGSKLKSKERERERERKREREREEGGTREGRRRAEAERARDHSEWKEGEGNTCKE